MQQRFEIPGRLPGLNEYTRACRGNKYAGADCKRRAEAQVLDAINASGLKPVGSPYTASFFWYEEPAKNHHMRDKDNICFARKFIYDALQTAGIVKGDGWDDIFSQSDVFTRTAPGKGRVLVILTDGTEEDDDER